MYKVGRRENKGLEHPWLRHSLGMQKKSFSSNQVPALNVPLMVQRTIVKTDYHHRQAIVLALYGVVCVVVCTNMESVYDRKQRRARYVKSPIEKKTGSATKKTFLLRFNRNKRFSVICFL